MEVKKRKNEFIPYNEIDSKHITIMWDYKPIVKPNAKGDLIETPLATWQEYTFTHIPTLSEIKSIILDFYNTKINQQILSGFTWNDMCVWLSTENQFNYKVAYDLAIQTNGKNLPLVFKFGTDETPIYYTFETVEELSDFYLKAVAYVQRTLNEGWMKKKSINWNHYQNI